ncbi:hypothetical protein ACLOJK_027514 [Asimina triloba]
MGCCCPTTDAWLKMNGAGTRIKAALVGTASFPMDLWYAVCCKDGADGGADQVGSSMEMGFNLDGCRSATRHGDLDVMGVAHLAVISHHGWVDAQASIAAGSNRAS